VVVLKSDVPLIDMRRPIRPHVGADHPGYTMRAHSDRTGRSSASQSPFMVAL
jgi:hypothetical protein